MKQERSHASNKSSSLMVLKHGNTLPLGFHRTDQSWNEQVSCHLFPTHGVGLFLSEQFLHQMSPFPSFWLVVCSLCLLQLTKQGQQ